MALLLKAFIICNYESRTHFFTNVLYDGLPNQIAHSKREYQKLMLNTNLYVPRLKINELINELINAIHYERKL